MSAGAGAARGWCRNRLAAGLFLALTGGVSTVGALADAPTPVPPEVKVFNAHLVATTPVASSVFAITSDGGIRHIASGLVCPAQMPDFHLLDLQIYGQEPEPGHHAPENRIISI